jgi:DNA repair protein RecO (recombination protein O)
MQWTDEGIVLGVKRHGETSVILELMTQARGRHLGLVRGGSGTRLRGVLQPGGHGSTSISAIMPSRASTCAPPAFSPRPMRSMA